MQSYIQVAMNESKITVENFSGIVEKVCARDTSADPEGWSEKNPLWGHCAVVSLLAQDLFGGTLIRRSLETVAGLEHLRSHYSNRLTNGAEVDFTRKQFQQELPDNLLKEERDREQALFHPDTQKRYELLKGRFWICLTTLP